MHFLRYLFFCFLIISTNIFAKDIRLTNENNRFSVIDKTESGFKIINQLHHINSTKIKSEYGDFIKLNVPYYSTNSEIGNPELPALTKLISVPNNAKIDIKIINKISKKIKLSDFGVNDKVFPHQPSISKGANQDEIIFYLNDLIYNQDDFINDKIVSTEFLGRMREVELARIIISPFSYNPIKQELEIITNLEIEVNFSESSSVTD